MISRGLDYFFSPSVEYDPENKAQKAQIQKQLDSVSEEFNKLLNMDRVSLMPPAATVSLLWCFGCISVPLSLGCCVLLSYMISMNPKRQGQVQLFNSELNKLLEMYRWCAKKGVEVSHDQSFIKILEVLAPFVQTKDLLLWQNEEVSDRYAEIMGAPPHYQVFLSKERGQGSLHRRGGLFAGLAGTNPFIDSVLSNAPNFYGSERLIMNTIAEVKLWLYGSASENVVLASRQNSAI